MDSNFKVYECMLFVVNVKLWILFVILMFLLIYLNHTIPLNKIFIYSLLCTIFEIINMFYNQREYVEYSVLSVYNK